MSPLINYDQFYVVIINGGIIFKPILNLFRIICNYLPLQIKWSCIISNQQFISKGGRESQPLTKQ